MPSYSQDTTAVADAGDAVGEEGLASFSTLPSLSSRVLGAAATERTAEATTWEETKFNVADMELEIHGIEGAETSTIPTDDAEGEKDKNDVAYDDSVLGEVDEDRGQGFHVITVCAGGSGHDEEKDINIQESEEEESSPRSREGTEEKKETLDLQQEQEPGTSAPTSSSSSTKPLRTSGGNSNKQHLLEDPAGSAAGGGRYERTGDNDDKYDGHDHHPGHRGGPQASGMKSKKAQAQVFIPHLEPELLEEGETGTSSLASGSLGSDQLNDGHSKGPIDITPREPPQPNFMTSKASLPTLSREPRTRSESSIRIPPRDPPTAEDVSSSSRELPPSLGIKSNKAQPQEILPRMEPEEDEMSSSSLASGSIGLDLLCDGNSKVLPISIPSREPPQPNVLIVGMAKMQPDEPPQPPPREDARSKFMGLREPQSVRHGTIPPNMPGIFSSGGRSISPSRENNLSHEDSYLEPPFHHLLVSAIAVPIQDAEYEQQATNQVEPPESPAPIHDSSVMQSPPSQERRVRITMFHAFAAATAVLVPIIIGIAIAMSLASPSHTRWL